MTIFPSATFVGRGAELAELQAAYADAQVNTVLVSGEAGIGKSRLVREFVSRLGAGHVVVAGRCLAFGNEGLPYAPFFAALRVLARADGVPDVARKALAAWLPGSAEHAEPVDRIRLFAEVLTALEQVGDARALVLILEDLHWADESSLRLLSFLAVNLAHPDVLVIGTHRPADGRLRQLVAELSRVPAVRRVAPAPLSRHEVGRLLAGLLGREPDRATVARVFERTQGNPLFVEALSRSPEDPPSELIELLLAGLPQLSAAARQVLTVACVAGATVEHELLASVVELPETELRVALRQLVDGHVLVAGEGGYSFRHALIRQAVYERLLPVEREGLHRRLADAVPDQPARLAAHAFAAGDMSRALPAAWRAAADAHRAGAERERLHLLRRVLELWDGVPDAASTTGVGRLTVLDHAVEAACATSSVQYGLRWSAEALALAPSPLRHYQQARLKNLGNAGGREDLMQALAGLPADPPTVLRGNVLVDLAAACVFTADVAQAERYARDAADVAEHLGDRSLRARAYAYLGLAKSGDPQTAGEYFARARGAADPKTMPAVATWEAAWRIAVGEYLTAIEVIQLGLGAANETFEYEKHGPILLVKWVQALTALGRWDEALTLIDETLGEVWLPDLSHAALLISYGEIELARGNRAAAESSAASADGLLGEEPWARPYRLRLRTLQARLLPDRSAEIYAVALATDQLAAHPHEAWPLVAAAAPSELPDLAVVGPVDEACRATAKGDWEAAAAIWRRLGQPYELSQCLLAAAQARLAAGERGRADELLGEVTALGLGPSRLQAESLASRSGVQGNQRATPALGLTARELEVLRLVAEGRSNRQVAAELFISANTVGVHVSRILTKLGAATRTEAARKYLDAMRTRSSGGAG